MTPIGPEQDRPRAGKATIVEQEIREQPGVLARLLERERAGVEAVAREIRAHAPHTVLVAARGSSDNAARYAGYLFGIRNRLPVALASPSIFTHYQAPPDLHGTLVVGISQSGQSPDVVAVLDEARRQGALTLTITNSPDSPLAGAARFCLPLHAGRERAVAATKTYTAQLLALAMLSTALSGDPAGWAELAAVPRAVEAAIALNGEVAEAAVRFRYAGRFVSLGRGFNLATAFEVALKIEETSYTIAEPYSSADFLHGPVAMIEEGFPAIVIAPSGAVADDTAALLQVLERRRAEVIAVSDRPDLLARAGTALPLPPGVPEWLSPIVAVVPGQLWANALARVRGLDPDRPRGLAKVTRTR